LTNPSSPEDRRFLALPAVLEASLRRGESAAARPDVKNHHPSVKQSHGAGKAEMSCLY